MSDPLAISPNFRHVLYDDSNPKKWQGDPNVAVEGSGFSVPNGVESLLYYNDLVLNDLTLYDKYRVMGIDGLADADIRDLREDKSGDDGEDVYGSLYSGRTIVIKVRVEAYSLKKLRDMEEALRTAFVNMNDKPLYFLTGDPEKDHYINCRKSASLTKEEDVDSINYRHFRDWQITLRAGDPRFYRVKGKSLTTLVEVPDPELNPSSGFEVASAADGWSVVSSSGAYSSGITNEWAATGTQSMKISSTYKQSNTKQLQKMFFDIKSGTSYTIKADFKQINYANTNFVQSSTYIVMYFLDDNNNILNWVSGPTKIIPGMDEDTWSSSVTGVAPNNATRMICDFRINSSREYEFYVDNASVSYTYNYYQTKYTQLSNVGNYNTEPKIILTGGMSDISIYNNNAPAPFNNIKLKPDVTIGDGDVYVIDIKNRTMVDQDGNNKISDLDLTSGWMKLYPGSNKIYFGESTVFTSINSQFRFEWKDAWI